MEMQDILLKISTLRTTRKLSARELSLRIGMSAQYIGQLEHGKITLSVPVLLSILEVLEVSPEEFFSTSTDFKTDKALLSIIKTLPADKRSALLYFIKK